MAKFRRGQVVLPTSYPIQQYPVLDPMWNQVGVPQIIREVYLNSYLLSGGYIWPETDISPLPEDPVKQRALVLIYGTSRR